MEKIKGFMLIMIFPLVILGAGMIGGALDSWSLVHFLVGLGLSMLGLIDFVALCLLSLNE